MSKKHFNFKSSIRDWYIRAFPSDELGYRINPLATFPGAVKCMADGGDIYKYLGVGDSLVRENVFSKIAAITGVDYDAVYDLWLHHDEDECSRLIFLGDHPDCAVDRDWREQFDEVVSPSEQVRYDELLAAEEHRKAETFDSFMEVNETPMDEVRGAGIALMLMQGIVFAEIARNIDGPSEELDERIATFNRDLKRLYNEPLHKKVEQIESQVGKLEEKAAIYDEMRYTAEHTDPADIRIAEGSASMTGALMAAAMASYDLSCGLIDDEHIGRYGDVITALEERMGSVPADSPSRPRRASSSPTPRRTASASASTSPAESARISPSSMRTRMPTTSIRHPSAPSPTTAATRNRTTAPTCISTATWSSRDRWLPRSPRIYPPISPRPPRRLPPRASSPTPSEPAASSTRREA